MRAANLLLVLSPTTLVLAVGCGLLFPREREEPHELRVMSFNIEYGGDAVDFDTIVAAVEAADPDVVALNEAELSTERLASALGWPYSDNRTDVLSRYPVLEPPDADGLYSYVEIDQGTVVAVSNVHLPSTPYGPYVVERGVPAVKVADLEATTRVPYIEPYLEVLSDLALAGVPVYLGGDFNSPSHLDWTDAAVGARPHLLYALDWPVTVAVADAGFVDSYREVRPDPVTDPGLTWWAGRPIVHGYPDHDDPQDRIDLLFSAGPTSATSSGVVGEEGPDWVDIGLTEWGSDHRAVVSTFDVTPAAMPSLVTVADALLAPGDELSVRYHSSAGTAEHLAIVHAGGAISSAIELHATTIDDGTAVFATDSWSAGAYEALLLDRSDDVIARFPLWLEPAADATRLATDAAEYAAGDPIEVQWEYGPGNRWDWIALFRASDDPGVDPYLGYAYTGSEIVGRVVIDETARDIVWPLAPGEYTVIYFLNDGYVVQASSAPFTVAE